MTDQKGKATSWVGCGLVIRGRYGRTAGVGWSGLGRIRRNIVATSLGGGLVRELLTALFFPLMFLCQIPLAFLELVIWLGQEVSFHRREGGIERCECLFVLLEDDFRILVSTFKRSDRWIVVVSAEEVISLCAHHHLDRCLIAHAIFFGDERGYFVETFFIRHFTSRHFLSSFGQISPRHIEI
jgi:hypothetical protein